MRITTHSETIKPFYSFIKEIQGKRIEYPKGHVLNLFYKERGIPFTEMLYEVCQIRRVLIQWLVKPLGVGHLIIQSNFSLLN